MNILAATTIQVPAWSILGVVVLVVVSLAIAGMRKSIVDYRVQRQKAREAEEAWNQKIREEDRLEKEDIKRKKRRKEEEENMELDRLLPGPWRRLYDFLQREDMQKATRETVIMTVETFKHDVLAIRPFSEIPLICPAGLDAILSMSYHEGPIRGDCHPEVTKLLEGYVRFPETDNRKKP